MHPPENIKRKLLKPDTDGDGRADRRIGVILYTLSAILRMAGGGGVGGIIR